MKNIIFILLIGIISTAQAYGRIVTYLTPMPMPNQYHQIEQYQQALQVWTSVQKKIVARTSNVMLFPMPVPTKYQKNENYPFFIFQNHYYLYNTK